MCQPVTGRLVCTGVGVGAPGGDDGLSPGDGDPLGFGDGDGDGDGDEVDVAGQVCDRLNQFLAGATPVVVVTVPEPL